MHDCCDYNHFLHERLTALLPCLGPGEHHATWTRVSHTVLGEQWYLWEMRKGRKGKSHQHTVTTGEVIETEQKGEEKQGGQGQQGPQLPGQQSFGEGGANGEWLQGHPRNPSSKGPYQLLLGASKGWINNEACAWGKRASVRQQAAFYWAFWFSGTNYTTRANDPKTSFTKLGFHSMMEGDAHTAWPNRYSSQGRLGNRSQMRPQTPVIEHLKALVESADRSWNVKSWIHSPVPGSV